MQRILVPTDFSICAGFAEDLAVKIARKSHSEVIFMNCVNVGVDWFNLAKDKENRLSGIKAQIRHAEQALDERVQNALQEGVLAAKSLDIIEGSQSIANAYKGKGDLIVLGSHGTNGSKKMTIGSSATKVLRMAKSPVLVVQKGIPKPFAFKTIVFASGLEPDTHEALNFLHRFAEKVGTDTIHFVEITTPHNFKPTNDILTEMERFTAKHHFKNMRLHNYNHYSVETGIVEFSRNLNADLIAIANHGRTDLSGLFIDSIPVNLLKQTDCPLLSIRV